MASCRSNLPQSSSPLTTREECWTLTRIDLHNALKQRAVDQAFPGPPVKIHTGAPVASIDGETGRVILADVCGEDSKTSAPCDLVVGADGIYSRTRSSVIGHEVPLTSTGKNCYRCLIPTADLLADPETAAFVSEPGIAAQIAAADRRIVLYPCSGGRATNLVAFVPAKDVGSLRTGEFEVESIGRLAE